MCKRVRGTIATLSQLPMVCWQEPRQSGTNNTWRAVQRQLGSVVRARPINESECGRGRGGGAAQANAAAGESMRPDRSSPSPVLAWYKLIPACARDGAAAVAGKRSKNNKKKKGGNAFWKWWLLSQVSLHVVAAGEEGEKGGGGAERILVGSEIITLAAVYHFTLNCPLIILKRWCDLTRFLYVTALRRDISEISVKPIQKC